MTKRKSISYDHYLSKRLPPRLTDEELEIRVKKLRAGDRSQIPIIIESHMHLACYIAGTYMWNKRAHREDLVSAAMEGVAQAVNWHERLKDNQITPYIDSTVRRYLSQYIENQDLIRVPRRSWHTAKTVRQGFVNQYIPATEDDEEILDTMEPRTENPFAEIEYNELCESYYFTDQELEVIQYLTEGYGQVEISEMIGQAAWYVLKEIKKKVLWAKDLRGEAIDYG